MSHLQNLVTSATQTTEIISSMNNLVDLIPTMNREELMLTMQTVMVDLEETIKRMKKHLRKSERSVAKSKPKCLKVRRERREIMEGLKDLKEYITNLSARARRLGSLQEEVYANSAAMAA